VITLRGANPLAIEVGEAFADPGATATDAEDGNVPVQADCSAVDTRRAGRYACTYTATDRDGHTASLARTVVVGAPPVVSCARATASPVGHVVAARAVRGGWFNLRALATGDRADIGFGWDSWSAVTLHEGAPGQWYPRPPAGC
jgi:hypothetical protein